MKKTTLLLAHPLSCRACLWAALGLLTALALGPPPAQAAVTEAWVHRYNNVVSNANDQAVKVVRDAAGDIIVTGTTDGGTSRPDMMTIKYSGADGSVLWQQRYNGPANAWDYANAVAVDGSGNVVVTGSSWIPEELNDHYTAKYAAANGALLWEQRGPGGGASALAVDGSGNVVRTGSSYNTNFNSTDPYTAKYAAADGALLWEKRFNGPFGSVAEAVAVDGNGNVVVTGYSYNGTNSDYYTAKYAAADGTLLWEQRYNGPANREDRPQALAVDGSSNVVVTGSSYNGTSSDYYTAKYASADGALLWEKRSNGGGGALALDGNGNVVVSGASWNGTNSDYYTAKYAATDGALLWEQRYNGPANSDDYAQAVAVDGSGNVVVTGYSWTAGNFDYYTAKYAAADGALLWEQRYSYGSAQAVAVDGSGNAVVTGYSGNYPDSDYYTAKYAAADGALLWEQRYSGPANYDDFAQAVAVDGSGNVVVTGYSHGTNGNLDYYTAKYAAADGALLWEKRYNGPANRYDRASAVAVDGGGNVVVTGISDIRFNDFGYAEGDYYTAKYAAADGALLWEKRYNGPANDVDEARAEAVDPSGNVIVTGYSNNGTNSNSDYYTAKYAAANGALLWEKRYNGPANSSDRANAVAVDGNGNAVVTGVSWNEMNLDCYTAKYAAADGALLWEQRYNGPGNGDDFAYGVATDGSGNVVVTGYSYGGSNGFDYYTAKYAAADGALLWEERYNGPANGADVLESYFQPAPRSLALGPNGMVAITGSSIGSSGTSDYATVVYREKLPSVSIALVSTGIRLRFTGVPGRSYTIERAPAVTGPWTTFNTQTAPASGLLEYLDALPSPGSAFYRTVQP